jgi:ABC-type transport system substrate-binding protein
VVSPTTARVAVEPDDSFVLQYASPGTVGMRSNPFGSRESGAFPEPFAAHLYRTLPPTYTLVPELAADDEPPPVVFDGSAWIVRVGLNEGLTWSDGEAIDAFDIEYTFEDSVRLGIGDDLGWIVEDPDGLADLVSVAALDARTAEFRFNGRPSLERWHFGIATASILPEHFWGFTFADRASGRERDADLGMAAPSAGGYRFDSRAPDGTWTWAAVRGWWNAGAEYTVHDNGTVEYRNPVLDIDEVYGGVAAGEVIAAWVEGPYAGFVRWLASRGAEAANSLVPHSADLLVGGPHPDKAVPILDEADLLVSRGSAITTLVLDPGHPALATPDLRLAISCLVAPSFLIENVLDGSELRSGFADTVGQWSGGEFDDPCPSDEPGRFNAAMDRMRAAGWQWTVEPTPNSEGHVTGGTGLSHPDGITTSIRVISSPSDSDRAFVATTTWVASWLMGAGFDVEVVDGDPSGSGGPEWDLAIVAINALPIPRPLLAAGAELDLVHLDAETVGRAVTLWRATRMAIGTEALAMPLYVSIKLDLVSPDLVFPYRVVTDGIDPAYLATAFRRPA